MTTATRMPELWERVIFYDHQNLPKAAVVTATTETIDPRLAGDGGQVPRLSPGEVCLTIFPPTGGIEPRRNIQYGDRAGQWEFLEEYRQKQNGNGKQRR